MIWDMVFYLYYIIINILLLAGTNSDYEIKMKTVLSKTYNN